MVTLRLDEHVICGEIFNTSAYTVHGWVRLVGCDQLLSLQLTGNPNPELQGKRLRFEVPAQVAAAERETAPPPKPRALRNLAWQQVGPTGEMTVAGAAPIGGPSPAEAGPSRLFLEWQSQNGRVVLELANAKLEFVDPNYREPLPDDERPDELSQLEGPPPNVDDEDDDDLPADDPYNLFHDADSPRGDEDDDDEDEDDPLAGVFPEFSTPADATEDGPGAMHELIDELMEHSEGDPVGELFDGPLALPKPENLTEAQAEQALKTLLAKLALCGVALDVCQHFSPLAAYRLLVEEICREHRAFRELRGTQWVQHFSTADFCQQCDDEFKEEWERRDRKDSEDDEPGSTGDAE